MSSPARSEPPLTAWPTLGETPPPIQLDPDDEARVRSGEVIELTDEATAIAIADMAGSTDELIDFLILQNLRAGGLLDTVEIYRQDGDRYKARLVGGLVGIPLQIHTIVQCDRTRGFCEITLDHDRENTLPKLHKTFHLVESEGRVRVTVRFDTRGMVTSVPQFMRLGFASRQLHRQLEELRALEGE